MAVNYFLEKRANKEGELPIRAQICVKGVTRISTFGISIDPDVWDGNREQGYLPQFQAFEGLKTALSRENDRKHFALSR